MNMAAARSRSVTASSTSRTTSISVFSPGRRPAAEPITPAPAGVARGRAALCRRRHRWPPRPHGLRPRGPYRRGGGDEYAGQRRPCRLERRRGSRLGQRLLFDAAFQPGGHALGLADVAPSRHALGVDPAWVGDVLPDGTIGNARRVAGGPDESVFEPEWSPNGDLVFVSDRVSGWWNLYRERDGAVEAVAEMEAEFGRPQW